MPALVHTTFRVSNAKQFKESFEEKSEHGVGGYIPRDMMNTPDPNNPQDIEWNKAGSGMGELSPAEFAAMRSIPYYALDDQMYLFIGRVSAWNQFDTQDGSSNPNINENAPPYPVDSMKDSHFNHWDDMIAAKKVSAGEVSHVIKRERADEIKEGIRNWTRGKRYDTYDDRADNLFDDDILIHTVNDRFRVYKCVKQGIGTWEITSGTNYDSGVSGINTNYHDGSTKFVCWNHVSRRQPLATNPENPGITEDFMEVGDTFNDGYQWKYYYTIDAGEALKFVTTSYIPVRTIRKENGQRIDDYSDQWKVETNAIPGGILNVNVGKVPVEGTDGTIFGYEFTGPGTGGGAGYVQFAAKGDGGANKVTAAFDGSQSLVFKIQDWALNANTADATWPNPDTGNRFDFTRTGTFLNAVAANADAGVAMNTLLEGYGVVVKTIDSSIDGDIVKRYVYPIDSVSATGTHPNISFDLTIDPNWIAQRKADARMDTSVEGLDKAGFSPGMPVDVEIEIHPKVNIRTNHQSTTASDKTNSFEAFAICEPFYDLANAKYHDGYPGRVVDVRVTNPGMYHYRIDNYEYNGSKYAAEVAGRPTVSLPALNAAGVGTAFPAGLIGIAAEDASVFPSIPPVGGHGADPTNEFGGFNVMINARFEGTEADEFTVGNEFRKIGILKNPLAYANTANDYDDLAVRADLNTLEIGPQEYDKLFRGYKTDQCYRINLEDDSKLTTAPGGAMIFFEPDMEIGFFVNSAFGGVWPSMSIYDGSDPKDWVDGGTYGVDVVTNTQMESSCIATARLVDHDTINKRIRVIKPRGDFFTVLQGTPAGVNDIKIEVRSLRPHSVENANVFAMSLQTANTAEEPGMLPGSGKILYIENRSMVSRSSNQTEDLKISIQF